LAGETEVLGENLVHCGGKLAADHLSYGMAFSYEINRKVL
jgi:hypothetical protein